MEKSNLYLRILWLAVINILGGFAIYYITDTMNQNSTVMFVGGSVLLLSILFFLFDQFYKFIKNLKN